MIHEAEADENIYEFVRRVQKILRGKQCNHTPVIYDDCLFNGIKFSVYSDSNLYDIVEIYGLKCELRRMKRC